MSDNITFARNLVKGKIAETVFAQMFRETENFTVIEFGYEKVAPELVSHGYNPNHGIIETIKSAPDFAVIDRSTNKVHLIEVKYQHYLNPERVLKFAQRMAKSWNPSYLFVATQNGFYLGALNNIIAKNGYITSLSNDQVPAEIQNSYLQILIDFEGSS